jgi:hypothetical protein
MESLLWLTDSGSCPTWQWVSYTKRPLTQIIIPRPPNASSTSRPVVICGFDRWVLGPRPASPDSHLLSTTLWQELFQECTSSNPCWTVVWQSYRETPGLCITNWTWAKLTLSSIPSPPGSNKDAETTDGASIAADVTTFSNSAFTENELSPKQELTSLQGNWLMTKPLFVENGTVG